ncbi:N-acetylneuraminate synthase [Thermosulfuriphilus ammonigenes]|uniref:N-acetylneuraminate synthase n=1 Tax=Thermosulfuriphilus ammonigenes TaxID=1936021 RepID=A0A6G7PXK9_9BACT|nr:N-acetylneuraminate synthase family protein [Thermosulfuriphilus ammonigenes]MBA2849544.1 N-acetylneuraminate synthase/sialic acid synthase [Thermosulfuriphilus ammonigenes]QIJ72350.1 N-acetylneuraminate synthase [Thermosulfuriphilus ammonigenes]
MKTITFGRSQISSEGPCYVIAEIGHNHQGNLDIALEMIEVAARCGVQAVKFQKRDNKSLFTKEFYNKPYDNENSYGSTYGEHREFLEFGLEEYKILKKAAEENGVEFMATAFDFKSVDFLEDLGITSYKVASGDLTNIPLLTYIAKLKKPMFISTGAATLEEIRMAYEAVLKYNDQICLLHCVAGYPTEYEHLNLKFIETLKKEFPEAIIGYSGHDNGILAAVIAYMLGATVVEKHFTLNRAWKGTDHKFSLEPEGLRKQVRDLRRVDLALGDGKKIIYDFEWEARKKMGKGIYSSKKLPAGKVLTWDDVVFKTPANGTPPYLIEKILGKTLKVDLEEESPISLDLLE